MSVHEKQRNWAVVKHCSGEFSGHVQCEYCKAIFKVKEPNYYAIYETSDIGVFLGKMVGFSCEHCFKKNVRMRKKW